MVTGKRGFRGKPKPLILIGIGIILLKIESFQPIRGHWDWFGNILPHWITQLSDNNHNISHL